MELYSPKVFPCVPSGGDKRDRTADLLNAIQALSQLSYTPTYCAAALATSIIIPSPPENVNTQFAKQNARIASGSAADFY